MKCETVLPGTECSFWSKQGCVFEGNSCQKVVDECQGCARIVDSAIGQVCSAYPSPAKKWAAGLCNFATHRKVEIVSVEAKVNPLKASKKASGGKKK
ncbi:MAG: PxxKW family cysteine-rich protein [Syntrophotaleaceae bacterium]